MPHRFEVAPSARAGCSNKECKDGQVKIAKGELRVGSWVENGQYQAFSWRHWGCTTPKVLANIKSAWEELQGGSGEKDYSMLDGYDDLSEEHQLKVRNALEQGHVDNEDWKGDVEMNTPGSNGFRARKKKADQVKQDDDEAKDAIEAKPKARKARATKSLDTPATSSEPEEKKPAKKASHAKKATTGDASVADAEIEPKKRGRPAKADKAPATKAPTTKAGVKRKATDNGDNEATDNKPTRRGTRKARKTQAEEAEAVLEKPKRGRKKAEEAEAAPEKPKRGRKKAEKKSDN